MKHIYKTTMCTVKVDKKILKAWRAYMDTVKRGH